MEGALDDTGTERARDDRVGGSGRQGDSSGVHGEELKDDDRGDHM